jgi:hypothetical protein
MLPAYGNTSWFIELLAMCPKYPGELGEDPSVLSIAG